MDYMCDIDNILIMKGNNSCLFGLHIMSIIYT